MTLSQARAAAWRRLCEETSTPEFWSLYRRIRRGGGAQGVEDLRQGDRVMTTDTEKAEALSLVFFPDMPAMETDDQRAIDVAWRTHRPPGAIDGLGVSPLE